MSSVIEKLKKILAEGYLADSGSLAVRSTAKILGQLWKESFTGVVSISIGEIERYIILRDGVIETLLSSNEDERLGECLLLKGKITVPQLYRASKQVEQKGQKLAAALVEIGALDSEEILPALRIQANTILVNLLNTTHGEFTIFLAEPLEELGLIPLNISVPVSLIEASRYMKRWTPIRQDLEYMGRHPVFHQTEVWGQVAPLLTPEESHVVSLCNGRFSIFTICDMSYLQSFETVRLIWILHLIRLIEFHDQGVKPRKDEHAQERAQEPPPEYQEYVLQDLIQTYNDFYVGIMDKLLRNHSDKVEDYIRLCTEPIRKSMPDRFKNVEFSIYGEIDYEEFIRNFSSLTYERKIREVSIILEDILYSFIYNLEKIVDKEEAQRIRKEILQKHREQKNPHAT